MWRQIPEALNIQRNKMDWSYVAGLFDRSGNINNIKVKGREYLQIRFYSNNKGILEEIQHFIGCGKIYVKKLSKRNIKWHDRFELTITAAKEIFIVLSEMLPFLIVKQEKVAAIISHHALFRDMLSELKEETEEKEEYVSYIG